MQAAELFEQKIKPLKVARRLRVSPKSAGNLSDNPADNCPPLPGA
ncbi:hypothetical protein AB0B07_00600 [Streptomyces sioyaensis]